MKSLTIIFALITVFNFSFGQSFNGKIIYQATILEDSISNHPSLNVKMPPGFEDLEIKSGKDAVPIYFYLLINDKESLYKSAFSMEESIELGLAMNQTNLVGRQSQMYYNNLETKEKFFQSMWSKHVLVNLSDIDWQLTKETKKIGKYIAYKATALIDSAQTHGREYLAPVTAWYTPEVKLSFGIQNFVGLPGMTLELTAHYNEGKIHYFATSIELDSESDIRIEKPEAKRQISEKEYIDMIKELNAKRF